MATVIVRPRVDHLALAREYAARRHEWLDRIRFDPYRRWYTCLAAAPDAEVWLLTWLPGQGTELHDHGGSAGALLVVEGELTEQVAVRGSAGLSLSEATIGAGRGHRFGPRYVHRVSNNGGAPAVSIHVYGPALRSMTRYRLAEGSLRAVAVERAGASW